MNWFKHNLLFLILLFLVVTGIVYWFYWHWTPFTADAFVFANTRAVTSWVSGYISEIHVQNNQFVKKGTPLFTTLPTTFALKVSELEHELTALRSKLAKTRSLQLQAEAGIRLHEAEKELYDFLYTRGCRMLKSSAISEDYVARQKSLLKSAAARCQAARHQTQALQHACKELEAQIKKTQSSLALNQTWLTQTTVTALCDGIVTNMTLSPGTFCRSGDVLFAFIDTSSWYIQANFKESELSEIVPGTRAIIRLRQYPGRSYTGVVEQCNWSAERRKSSPGTGVAEIKKENEWFLLPQRFPVQIQISDPDEYLHFGASAYVTLDIPARPIRQFFWELFL